jgi:hypothetical protein
MDRRILLACGVLSSLLYVAMNVTKLTHSTTYDNSALNKANPDPSIVVHWGEQSWEEMLYGSISFRYAEEAPAVQQSAQTNPQ